ncbi:hypothetical protein BX600DRAFT_207745 [Xylariales sp. PMI_506]|nr:hypothetical protein BX600DRAFT_207745 [Xylariales sp. PMI_506]
MSGLISSSGLSCPIGGEFYTCTSATIRFVGCCTIDPCADGSGYCPPADLRESAFSMGHFIEAPDQECVAAGTSEDWYSCDSSTAFFGCCSSNPCENHGTCPQANLLAAELSSNATAAQAFLGVLSAASALATTTVSPSAAPSGGTTLSTGAIVGIALAGATVLITLLTALAFWYGCMPPRKKAWHEEEKEKDSPRSSFEFQPVSRPSPKVPDFDTTQLPTIGNQPTSFAPGFTPHRHHSLPNTRSFSSLQQHIHSMNSWNHSGRRASQMSRMSWS